MHRSASGLIVAALLVCSAATAQQTPKTPPDPSGKHIRGVRVIQPDAIAGTDPQANTGGTPTDDGGAAPTPLPKPSPTPVVVHSVIKACDRPFANPDLVLGGQGGFDRRLSDSLKTGRAVVIDLAEPFDAKGPPPPAMGRWLSEVKGAGGAVTVSPYCVSGRGISQWFADIVDHLTGSIYRPARNYDATLYADAGKRRVTQIEFKPKSSSALSSSR